MCVTGQQLPRMVEVVVVVAAMVVAAMVVGVCEWMTRRRTHTDASDVPQLSERNAMLFSGFTMVQHVLNVSSHRSHHSFLQ